MARVRRAWPALLVALALACAGLALVGGLRAYGAQEQRIRDDFDALLWLRSEDVVTLALQGDGTVDLTALPYAIDLQSFGIDIHLFDGAGTWLYAPAADQQQVVGLPALVPVRHALGGEYDLRTVTTYGFTTRVLTRPIIAGEGDNAYVALIIQAGRDEAGLAAELRRLRWIAVAAGAGFAFVIAGGGTLLARLAGAARRRALAQQRTFAANAAHELRTPIAIIQAAAELALLRPRSNEEYAAALREIAAASARTSTLVDDLLALARLDAGRERLRRDPVDLAALAAATVADGTRRYPDNPITVGAAEEVFVEGDAALLQRLIGNLIENACRYTPAGTPVHVAIEPRRAWAVLRVIDEGGGIPPAEVPRLFVRFFRGRGGRASGARGSGLGLSLVQQIAAAHGGRVSVASQPGMGTTVAVFLPATSARPAPDPPPLPTRA